MLPKHGLLALVLAKLVLGHRSVPLVMVSLSNHRHRCAELWLSLDKLGMT